MLRVFQGGDVVGVFEVFEMDNGFGYFAGVLGGLVVGEVMGPVRQTQKQIIRW